MSEQLVMPNRRGFIKMIGSLAVAAGAAQYAGVFADKNVPEPSKRWITDEGDFYSILIPAYKTLRNEIFDKPVLVVMNEGSLMEGCAVNGFINVLGRSGFLITNCEFDSTKHAYSRPRPVMEILLGSTDGVVSHCMLRSEVIIAWADERRQWADFIGADYGK